MMKLLNEAIINALPPLRSTEQIPLTNKTIICKFYVPGKLSWYVFEGEADAQKNYKFFGLMVDEEETVNRACLGYFYLSTLALLSKVDSHVQLDTSVFKACYNDALKKVVDATSPLCRYFLNEKIIRALPTIYSTQYIPLEDRMLICGFHCLDGTSWYVFEGELTAGDYQFFGIVDDVETRCDYFYFSELVEIDTAYCSIRVSYSPAFNVRYADIFACPKKV